MRFLYLYALLGIATVLGLCLICDKSHGQGYYAGSVYYYYPAPQVAYYRSYAPAYDAQPTYYVTYSSPEYYSYYSPCVTYAAPVCCEQSNSYARGDSYPQSVDSGYSPEQPAPMQPTTMVTVGAYDNRFEPQTTNVQSGTTVRWVNYGQHNHTITASDDRWDSGDIKPGGTYSATFKEPGTYSYYCRHHTKDKMQGTIVVGSSVANEYRAATQTGY